MTHRLRLAVRSLLITMLPALAKALPYDASVILDRTRVNPAMARREIRNFVPAASFRSASRS